MKKIILIFCIILCNFKAYSQQDLQPTLPVLNFTPDAASAAMGDMGAATPADAFSQTHNAAKYVLSDETSGAGLSYTPWLRKASSDMNIVYLSGFSQFGGNQSVSASIRYFTLGNIDLYTSNAEYLNSIKPNEFYIDAAYGRRLSKYMSGAVTFRYINSARIETENFNSTITHSSNFAADVAFYYQKPIETSGTKSSEIAFGAAVSNIGTKLKTTDTTGYFLPMRLRIGSRVSFLFDEDNTLSVGLEIIKSLVPTNMKYKNSSVLSAMTNAIGSDLGKMYYALGVEYDYKKQFFARAGYHYEPKSIYNNSYATFGGAIRYGKWDFAVSYLFLTSNSGNNLLSNTYRLSVCFYFGNNSYKKRYGDF